MTHTAFSHGIDMISTVAASATGHVSISATTKLVYLTYMISIATIAVLMYCTRPARILRLKYLLSGLHCPRCTSTVEESLKSIDGVQNVNVNWRTKEARIDFSEQKVNARQIQEQIAGTCHMFGPTMSYSALLEL